MKKTLLMVAALSLCSSMVWAKSDQAILAEAQKNTVSVAQAKKMPDETGVTLTGKIVRQLKVQGDEFEFGDKTGNIIVDIDDKHWRKLGLKAGDRVRLIGEVDTHRTKPTEIEVIRIDKLK